MKPRLESARDTHEDADIWVRLLMRQPRQGAYLRFTMWGMYRDADRRDADLMLVLGWWRVKKFVRRWYYAAMASEYPGLAAGGADWWPGNHNPLGLDITYFA